MAKVGAPSGPGAEHGFLAQLLLPLHLGEQEFFPIVGTVDVAGPELRRQTVTLTVEQQQRVITGGLEVAVVRAILLLTVNRNLSAVHVQHDPPRGIDGFRLGDEFAVDAGQTAEVILLGQHLGVKGLQARGQCRATIPSLLRTDQPERRILPEPFGA